MSLKLFDKQGRHFITILDNGDVVYPDGTPYEFKEKDDDGREEDSGDHIPSPGSAVQTDQQRPHVSQGNQTTMDSIS